MFYSDFSRVEMMVDEGKNHHTIEKQIPLICSLNFKESKFIKSDAFVWVN